MFKITTKFVALFVLAFFFISCSSIFNGSLQQVQVGSSEQEAEVWVNGNNMGKAPTALSLKRGETHIIEIKKKGFDTYRITTTKSITGWFWGNLICGGLVGMVIDLATGNAYDVEPNNIMANMSKSTSYLNNYDNSNYSYVFIKNSKNQYEEAIKITWE